MILVPSMMLTTPRHFAPESMQFPDHFSFVVLHRRNIVDGFGQDFPLACFETFVYRKSVAQLVKQLLHFLSALSFSEFMRDTQFRRPRVRGLLHQACKHWILQWTMGKPSVLVIWLVHWRGWCRISIPRINIHALLLLWRDRRWRWRTFTMYDWHASATSNDWTLWSKMRLSRKAWMELLRRASFLLVKLLMMFRAGWLTTVRGTRGCRRGCVGISSVIQGQIPQPRIESATSPLGWVILSIILLLLLKRCSFICRRLSFHRRISTISNGYRVTANFRIRPIDI